VLVQHADGQLQGVALGACIPARVVSVPVVLLTPPS
jgi:hypothetical protein